MMAASIRRPVLAGGLARLYFFSPEGRCSPMSQASSPRQMLPTLVPDPLPWSVGRAHTHSRKAGFELPFVPVRQLMFCHLASASISSVAIDRMFGTFR